MSQLECAVQCLEQHCLRALAHPHCPPTSVPFAGPRLRYDFFADREHEDRFRRKFTATWLPKHGDSDNNVDGYTPKRRSLLGDEQLLARGGEAAVAGPDGSSSSSSSMLALRQREEAQLLGMPRRLHGEQQEQLQVRKARLRDGA